MEKFAKIFTSFFGVGYLRPMPGTYASIITFVAGYFLFNYFNRTSILFLFIILIIISYYSINLLINNLSDKDPSLIVIDEILGSILILIFVPYSLAIYIIALLIFRLFDGQKIWPINIFNKIKTPFGIIIDDLAAGLITIILTRFILLIINKL